MSDAATRGVGGGIAVEDDDGIAYGGFLPLGAIPLKASNRTDILGVTFMVCGLGNSPPGTKHPLINS